MTAQCIFYADDRPMYLLKCDNLLPADSSSETQACGIERGWRCFGEDGKLSRCETLPRCGSGRREIEKGEACDDGNLNSGDGCSSECTIELNYVCKYISIFVPDICCATLELCGNGILGTCISFGGLVRA